jgi:hypothetical protein
MTGPPNGRAQFDPNLTDADLERLQLECVRSGMELAAANEQAGLILFDRCHVRGFYRRFTNVIGASGGEFTYLMYVEYHNSGNVHGRPIIESELDQKRRHV